MGADITFETKGDPNGGETPISAAVKSGYLNSYPTMHALLSYAQFEQKRILDDKEEQILRPDHLQILLCKRKEGPCCLKPVYVQIMYYLLQKVDSKENAARLLAWNFKCLGYHQLKYLMALLPYDVIYNALTKLRSPEIQEAAIKKNDNAVKILFSNVLHNHIAHINIMQQTKVYLRYRRKYQKDNQEYKRKYQAIELLYSPPMELLETIGPKVLKSRYVQITSREMPEEMVARILSTTKTNIEGL